MTILRKSSKIIYRNLPEKRPIPGIARIYRMIIRQCSIYIIYISNSVTGPTDPNPSSKISLSILTWLI